MTPLDAPDPGIRDMALFDVPAPPAPDRSPGQAPVREAAGRRRLQARLLRAGREAVDDRDLLELLLSGRRRASDACTIAADLLEIFGTAPRVLAARPDRLRTVPGLTGDAIAALKAAEALGIRMAREEMPDTVRPTFGNYRTPLGTVAADLTRHVLREIEAAEAKIGAAVSGRTGRFRITADPMWMEAVLAPAIARFRDTCPGVELTLRTASFVDGLRLLTCGESDLHCGAIDVAPLPAFLRRERVLDTTAGIVARAEHPLLAGRPAVRDLVSWPWIDYGGPVPAAAADSGPASPDGILGALHARTGRRVKTVLRADAAGLFLLATGPWLARLPLDFLDGLPGTPLRPLPLGFGRRRCPAGLVARRSAEDLAPFRRLQKAVRDAALERSRRPAG